MNLLRVNFQELYERHLCRHSQYGINVIHLATVIGTYLALFGIAAWLFESWWVVPAIALPYLAVLAFNIPFRVLAVTLVFLGLFFALFFMLFFPLPSSPLLPVADATSRNYARRRALPAPFSLSVLGWLPPRLSVVRDPHTRLSTRHFRD